MSAYEMAKKNLSINIRLLGHVKQEQFDAHLKAVVNMVNSLFPNEVVDTERLRREVMTNFNIWTEDGTEMVDKTDHIVWLPDIKSSIPWNFWNRYRQYLEEVKDMPPQVVMRIDSLTDKILGHLENPKRPGLWDRRGMVVGDVQSGKTSNYTSLICKAVDAQYKIIIVLAGMHNSLRSQTQLRLDEGFLGFDTQTNLDFNQQNRRLFGVGNLQEHGDLIVHSLTSSADNGDYRSNVANNVNFMLGGDPVLLVVKKNASVLKNVLKWLTTRGKQDPTTGEYNIDGIPLLLIDDEADNASIDGKTAKNSETKDDYEPTAINKAIRLILKTFKQSAYVGYTATPFANIFIYPPDDNVDKNKYGEDLFPRSFIVNLPAPSNYIGPSQLFGLNDDPESGIESQPGLPILKPITDNERLIPSQHKKDSVPKMLPDSLKKAIRVFVLSCAARIVRGQENEHNSMLIHVTRFNSVQLGVNELVAVELGMLKKRIELGDGKGRSVMEELRELWEAEFAPVTPKIMELVDDPLIQPVTWEEVRKHIYTASAKIQVRTINGTAGEVLDYRNHKKGLSVIAIGGDKLSRGLTLEGLTVSYYLRASKMYDTLLQMGRWFGYRPGYLDLCRIYTTKELIEWYKHIALANEELRREFDFMAASGGTPENYGLKVRTHPEGLQITATNKLRHGTKMKVTFAGKLVESVAFHKDPEIIKNNYQHTVQWLGSLQEAEQKTDGNVVWHGIQPSKIIEFLEPFTIHPQSRKAETSHIAKYIKSQMAEQELTKWTVVVISSNSGKPYTIEPQTLNKQIGLILRNESNESTDTRYLLRNNHLISPSHEHLDIIYEDEDRGEAKINRALEKTIEAWAKKETKKPQPSTPSGYFIRQERDKTKGLLLLYLLDPKGAKIDGKELTSTPFVGYAISFPSTPNAKEIEYMVDTTYWRDMYGEEEDEEE